MEAVLGFVESIGGWLSVAIIAAYLVIGFPIIKESFENLFRGELFDENFLMTVASAGAIAIGEYSEALMVMTLYRIGEYLQDRAVDKSRRAITELIDIRPDYANIPDNHDLKKVDPSEIKVGDTIVVLPGERIPADCTVLEGFSRIDTAALTGESMPSDVEPGTQVCSGCVNLDGLLKLRVDKEVSQSTAARILDLVENAAFNRAKTENFITKFARYYTPIVCAIAVLTAVVPSLVTGDWPGWIRRAVIMLVVSCPCALVISIPLGFFGGIGGASKKGILIKGGNYLETLSKADTVVFDKTGTLTKGVFTVVAIHPEDMKESKLLELATYAECFSNHPIARSLADAYGKHIDKARVKNFQELQGQGVKAEVNGVKLCCGSLKFMESLGIDAVECHIPGSTVHVSVDGTYAGHIVISDQLKDDAEEALKTLKSLGVSKTVMITGDKKAIAEAIGKDLPSLDDCHYETLPEDKVNITKEIMESLDDVSKAPSSKKKTLAFVGDGINDAPVLTVADVGVAMGGMGSAAAVEAADVVLMNDRPSDVAVAIRIARKTMKIVRENIAFSLGVKILVLILAAFGLSTMWMAEFADVGVCLLAILNSMRALKA